MQVTVISPRNLSTQLTPSLKVVALGDSLIYGFGDPVGGGWVERLRRSWMGAGSSSHALYNLGIRGDGVSQVSKRLESEFRHRGELRNRLPDLMILSVGVNDSARLGRLDGRNFTEFARFQSEMEILLDRASQLCPVLFIGMVPVDEAKMPFLDCLYYNHDDQFRYKEATRLACQKRGIPYLDLFSHWLERGRDWCNSRLTEDGLHPNVSGYETMFTQVTTWQPFIERVSAHKAGRIEKTLLATY
ncbi:GDSL-type esterase/lipase family protein [Leptodesmis sp.]|uniref:GDSL-type esterase/lipase family protein n=1 Tax=Leptodesmis sp. TaxID=3100501 RepID=UPI0040535825